MKRSSGVLAAAVVVAAALVISCGSPLQAAAGSASPVVDDSLPAPSANEGQARVEGSGPSEAIQAAERPGQTPLPDYHALVIGINEYKHWVPLREARQDAEKVADLLAREYGFSVTALYDQEATLEKISRELLKLVRTSGPNDALLIYFSGHGHFETNLEEGYWIPVEARGKDKVGGEWPVTEWLDNTKLRQFIAKMKARHVLVVSDSCFSGMLFRGAQPDAGEHSDAWCRQAVGRPSRWSISSGDTEVADNSVFARQFALALEHPMHAMFSASELAARMREKVAGLTGQYVRSGPFRDPGGTEGGEFVFVKGLVPPSDQEPVLALQERFAKGSRGRVYDSKLDVTWTVPAFNSFMTWREAEEGAKQAQAELPTLEQLSGIATSEPVALADRSPVYLDTRFFPSAYTPRGGRVLVWSARRRHGFPLADSTENYYDFTSRKAGHESHEDERANVFYVQPGKKAE